MLRLRVLADERYTCTQCGDCCRTMTVRVTAAEKAALEAAAPGLADVGPMFDRRDPDLLARRDGACVFLGPDQRCVIHARLGAAAKPLACRFFPFTLAARGPDLDVGLRFNCRGVLAGTGAPLGDYLPELEELARRWEEREPEPAPERIGYDAKRGLGADEAGRLGERLAALLRDPGLPFVRRLEVAGRLVAQLGKLELDEVAGDRFAELLGILARHFTDEPAPATPALGAADRLLFGLWASTAYRSLEARRGGPSRRALLRVARLRGEVPFAGAPVRLEDVRRTPLGPGADEVLGRYAAAKLHGRSFSGRLFPGYPLRRGFVVLSLQLATALLLARAHARRDGRAEAGADDVGRGLHDVDVAASERLLPRLLRTRLVVALLDVSGAAPRMAQALAEPRPAWLEP